MTGHEVLLKLRRSGVLPSTNLFVTDTDSDFDSECANVWHREESSSSGLWEPHVQIAAVDVPEQLDLRFCIGLTVFLSAQRSLERAQRLFKAIRSAKPEFLACVADQEVWFYSREAGGNGKRFQ